MAKKKSRKGKGSFLNYTAENRLQKNRNRKLQRHLKKFPNDLQAAAALKHTKTPRKPSRGTNNTVSKIQVIMDKAGNKSELSSFLPWSRKPRK